MATNAVEPIAPVSQQTLFTGLALTIVEYGASYRPGSQPPCWPFSHDPKNPLSHDLDSVMAALSAQIGSTLTFSSRLVPACQNGCATIPHTHLTCSSTPSSPTAAKRYTHASMATHTHVSRPWHVYSNILPLNTTWRTSPSQQRRFLVDVAEQRPFLLFLRAIPHHVSTLSAVKAPTSVAV
jgi:hypothetical protein